MIVRSAPRTPTIGAARTLSSPAADATHEAMFQALADRTDAIKRVDTSDERSDRGK